MENTSSLHCISLKNDMPVWMILEDDASMTNNFVARLYSVIEALPSDFHICQIGYSRPRNAPLKEYGSTNIISIPAFTYFMTGE